MGFGEAEGWSGWGRRTPGRPEATGDKCLVRLPVCAKSLRESVGEAVGKAVGEGRQRRQYNVSSAAWAWQATAGEPGIACEGVGGWRKSRQSKRPYSSSFYAGLKVSHRG
jgi:hypothetical protein